MKKLIFSLTMAAALLAGSAADAADVNAELVMSAKTWKGTLKSREGDWITFMPDNAPRSMRLGANTIKELIFDVQLSEDRLNSLNQQREYQAMIDELGRALKPYEPYDDIPSNLTKYKSVLMELYYKLGNYEETLRLADKIISDKRDERFLEKGQVFKVLAYIDSGELEKAEELLAELGWIEGLNDESEPAHLFIAAKVLAGKKDYPAAMEVVAKNVAFNSQDPDWMIRSEYLCAEIYVELGASNPIMYESAEEVIKQISLLYPNSNEADKANALKIRLDQLRAQSEL